MSDKEIEILIKHFQDVETLELLIDKGESFENDDISIDFIDNNGILIRVGNLTIQTEKHYLKEVINEIKKDKITKNAPASIISESDQRNNISHKGLNVYYVHEEFVKDMIYARQVLSGYGTYKQKLIDLIKIFRDGNQLNIGNQNFKSMDEFVAEYLSSQSDFNSIEGELKK